MRIKGKKSRLNSNKKSLRDRIQKWFDELCDELGLDEDLF